MSEKIMRTTNKDYKKGLKDISKKYKIDKTFEDEVKIFGLGQSFIIRHLSTEFIPESMTYAVDIYTKGDDKVKIISLTDTERYIQYKEKVKNVGNGKTRNEYNSLIKDYDQVMINLAIMKYELSYSGIKNRIKWQISKDVNISLDTWITGPLSGVDYFEIENTNKSKDVNFTDMIGKLIHNSAHPAANVCQSNYGTMTLVQLYDTYNTEKNSSEIQSFSNWMVSHITTKELQSSQHINE